MFERAREGLTQQSGSAASARAALSPGRARVVPNVFRAAPFGPSRRRLARGTARGRPSFACGARRCSVPVVVAPFRRALACIPCATVTASVRPRTQRRRLAGPASRRRRFRDRFRDFIASDNRTGTVFAIFIIFITSGVTGNETRGWQINLLAKTNTTDQRGGGGGGTLIYCYPRLTVLPTFRPQTVFTFVPITSSMSAIFVTQITPQNYAIIQHYRKKNKNNFYLVTFKCIAFTSKYLTICIVSVSGGGWQNDTHGPRQKDIGGRVLATP